MQLTVIRQIYDLSVEQSLCVCVSVCVYVRVQIYRNATFGINGRIDSHKITGQTDGLSWKYLCMYVCACALPLSYTDVDALGSASAHSR